MPHQANVRRLDRRRKVHLMDPRARPPEGLARHDVAQTQLIGHAETTGGPAALDDGDPIVQARAVRRALAGAGRKAVDVDALVVSAPLVPTAEACRGLARRALGPHGAGIPALGVVVAGDGAKAVASDGAEALAMGAAAALQAATIMDASALEGWELAACVGLGRDGTTVALCLSRRPGWQGPGSGQQRPGEEADDGPAEQQRDGPDPTA